VRRRSWSCVENRSKDNSYDVDNQLNSGPFVWHVVEHFPTARTMSSTGVTETGISDATYAAQNAMGDPNDWGRFTVRFLGSVGDNTLPVRFTGNANASVQISNLGSNASTIGVRVERP
jgi:hypothetical protein